MLQFLRQIGQGAMFQVDNAIPHRGHDVDDYMYVHVNSINRMYWPANLPGLEVIKLVFIELKIKRNDWLLADTCPQETNDCALF